MSEVSKLSKLKSHIRILLIGCVMGAAEIVPGVSGGTIAFVTGIYQRLLHAIRQATPMLLITLRDEGLKVAWARIDGTFLVTLLLGMGLAIVSLASLLGFLLDEHPIFIWSFFFSLVLASACLVFRDITEVSWTIGAGVGFGTAFGLVITSLAPVALEPTPFNFFLGGSVAICAWILPGVSGSFILLILGLYRFVIEAIREVDLLLLVSLAAGCGIGIICFAQVLTRLFAAFRNQTLAVLIGFMLGSLQKLWPWQHTLSYQLKADGSKLPMTQEVVTPWTFESLTGSPPEISMAVAGFILGLVAVAGLNLLRMRTELK